MEESIKNDYVGLVDYKDLEENILSSIRLGKPLTGKGGSLTPLIKKLLEASL
ncbi:IS256 family transposase, partial [Candidatus Cardinium hertigii]